MDTPAELLRDAVRYVFPEKVRLKLVGALVNVKRELDGLKKLVDLLAQEDMLRILTKEERGRFYELAEWEAALHEHLRRVLAPVASGRDFLDDAEDRYIRFLRAQRASMEAYFLAAAKINILDNDVLARLRSKDAMQAIQARAECMAAFVLQTMSAHTISGKSKAPHGKVPDFGLQIRGEHYFVEVKAPIILAPMDLVHEIDDYRFVRQVVVKAAEQIPPAGPGIIVLCPTRTGFPIRRRDLTSALYGPIMGTAAVTPAKGQPVPSEIPPELSGALTKCYRNSDGAIVRARTRVSGIVCIRERFDNDALLPGMDLEVYGLENPFAKHPFPRDLLEGVPLCQFDGTTLAWSDETGVR